MLVKAATGHDKLFPAGNHALILLQRSKQIDNVNGILEISC